MVSALEGTFNPGLAVSAARDHIANLRPDLPPDSAKSRSALLLLVATFAGQRVHKLAMLTGYPCEFVARCARRLVDNGVWRDGVTVASWTPADVGSEAFWCDVGVTEGKLCRRSDEAGAFQWAPAGMWWKDFDHRSNEDAARTQVTRYRLAATAAEPLTGERVMPTLSLERDSLPFGETEPGPPRAFSPRDIIGPVAAAAIRDVMVLGTAPYSETVWLT